MGILLIIYFVLAIVALGAQVLLYKNEAKNSIFIFNMLLGMILAYMAYTSFPSNFEIQRNLALGIASISIIAILLKSINIKFLFLSKILLTISILGGFIQLIM